MTRPVRWKVGQCDVFRILEGQYSASCQGPEQPHLERLPVATAQSLRARLSCWRPGHPSALVLAPGWTWDLCCSRVSSPVCCCSWLDSPGGPLDLIHLLHLGGAVSEDPALPTFFGSVGTVPWSLRAPPVQHLPGLPAHAFVEDSCSCCSRYNNLY